jgi:cobalt-zinc-cadmium efflux system membrane fusion protein
MDSTGKGVPERELEQATNDQQTAEGAFKAAKDAVRVFGKTEEEINKIVELRKIDPSLVVPSPIDGQITARFAQPGLLVQPGVAPAPYSMADISTKWMLASVEESDAPKIRVGQPVEVSVMAHPGQKYTGKIVTVGATVDPVLHRVTTRSDILDPKHELLPNMVCTFKIVVGEPVESLAIPEKGVSRESDGTMTTWVTTDRHHFTQRVVMVGMQGDGLWQVLGGLKRGEIAVTEGSVFISNILYAPPSD